MSQDLGSRGLGTRIALGKLLELAGVSGDLREHRGGQLGRGRVGVSPREGGQPEQNGQAMLSTV